MAKRIKDRPTGHTDEELAGLLAELGVADDPRAGRKDGVRVQRRDTPRRRALSKADWAQVLRDFEKSGRTERDAVAAVYGISPEQADTRIAKAKEARARHYKGGVKDLIAASDAYDLESLPVHVPGSEAETLVPPRAAKGPGGKFIVVGPATQGPGRGRNHATEVARIAADDGVRYDPGTTRALDADRRSAAYPGNSTAVLYDARDTAEELLHLMARPSQDVPSSADDASAAAEAMLPTVDEPTRYYVYGNESERLSAMNRLKAAWYRQFDGSEVTPRKLSDDYGGGFDAADAGANAVMREFRRLNAKIRDGEELNPAEKKAWSTLSSTDVWDQLARTNRPDFSNRADAKGGEGEDRFATSRNFLATDRVPDTIFGIPVVSRREDYSEKDLEFFRKHPEAGGYYDLGDDEPVEDGTEEGAPVQGAEEPAPDGVSQDAKGGKARGRYPGASNNPGNVEKHEIRRDKTLFKGEVGGGKRPKRFAVFSDPVDGLNAAATVIARRAADLREAGKDFTIANYAPLYAPPTENDTAQYVKNLSKYSGIPSDEVLDPHDTDRMAKLLKNVVRFESGAPHSAWFTDDEYAAAAELMKEGAFD